MVADTEIETTILQGLKEELLKKSLMARYEPPLYDHDAVRMAYVEVASWDVKNGFVWRLEVYCRDGCLEIHHKPHGLRDQKVFELCHPDSIEHATNAIWKKIRNLERAAERNG